MKERIRQILREETSGLGPKMLNAAYKMMDNLTKDCLWYYDTPEQRFEYTPQSIWLINPNTKQWMLQLLKSGDLLYSYKIYPTFRKYFNMELSDFQSFIKLWVVDALKRGVSTTANRAIDIDYKVEDALKRGVSTTGDGIYTYTQSVEDALKRGVSTTWKDTDRTPAKVEDAIKRGVSKTMENTAPGTSAVEDALKKGKELR
jgi:hypothetical protein